MSGWIADIDTYDWPSIYLVSAANGSSSSHNGLQGGPVFCAEFELLAFLFVKQFVVCHHDRQWQFQLKESFTHVKRAAPPCWNILDQLQWFFLHPFLLFNQSVFSNRASSEVFN